METLWLTEVILDKADVSCQLLCTINCCARYTYSIGWLVILACLNACRLAFVQTKTQILCGYQSVLQTVNQSICSYSQLRYLQDTQPVDTDMSLLGQALEPGQPIQGVEEGSTGTALCKL
jgi:hypothetical protein